MGEKLYYEKTNVTSDSEVKETYAHAVELNYKYYRAVTKSGAYFGWTDNHHVKAIDGQDWFKNPYYKEQPELQEVLVTEALAEPLTKSASEPINEIAESVDKIPVVEETTTETDYATLYEEKCTELEQYKTHSIAIETELNAIKSAFLVIANEIQKATMGDKE